MMRHIASLMIAAAFPTFAVADGMPANLMEAVRAIGPVIDMPNTAKIYAPLHAKEPYAGVSVQRDIAYGAANRNLLDVFSTGSGDPAKSVLVFVHGGGHVRGDRRVSGDSPFYDNIPLWAARNGMVGISITYRLAPQHPWPAGAEDVGAAIAWVKANVARYGGNPSRIFLMGHSAGATHVAAYVGTPKLHDAGSVGIAGVILVSGTFLLKPEMEVPEGQKAYFGADPALWAARSSLSGLAASGVPMLVVHGEVDVPYYIIQAEALKAALCETKRCPSFGVLPGHSHISEILAINTMDTSLTDQILRFIRG
jgi:acetyl esterase/lipase